MSLVLRKSILYSYAHKKGTDQTARMPILIRILGIRCSDNLCISSVCQFQTSEVLLRLSRLLLIIPLYCNRNSKHLSRPYKIYLTKLSFQNAEPFLINEITPNSIHVSKPTCQYTILI